MHNHRKPQASVSKQAPSDNFTPGAATSEPLLISPHLQLVEIAPRDADALTTAVALVRRRRERTAAPQLQLPIDSFALDAAHRGDGACPMTEHDIIKALAILAGSHRRAKDLLARTTVRHLANAPVEELQRLMPGRIARRFHAAVRLAKTAIAPERSASIETQSAAYAHVYPFFVGRETERFISVACDIHYKVIATEVIAEGLPDEVEARIADVFALTIRHRAVSLLVAHNHPAGDPTPKADFVERRRVNCDADAHASIILQEEMRFWRPRHGDKLTRPRRRAA